MRGYRKRPSLIFDGPGNRPLYLRAPKPSGLLKGTPLGSVALHHFTIAIYIGAEQITILFLQILKRRRSGYPLEHLNQGL